MVISYNKDIVGLRKYSFLFENDAPCASTTVRKYLKPQMSIIHFNTLIAEQAVQYF